MSKGGGQVQMPSPEDYMPLVEQQRVDQTTPFGGITWGDDGVSMGFSPELQGLFDKQFDPNAYNQYGADYMARAKRHLDPIYAQQSERFGQTMANRGQPVGGELYDDTYANLMDAQNRGWQEAAFGATQAGDRARMQDYNRLMGAMGASQVNVPQGDVMGAANMAMNVDMANLQASGQESSNIWNTAAQLGGSYLMGGYGGGGGWWGG